MVKIFRYLIAEQLINPLVVNETIEIPNNHQLKAGGLTIGGLSRRLKVGGFKPQATALLVLQLWIGVSVGF
ncbi:hypothetical protein CRENPOLYSF2_10009 [Crenothrix polyspora]|uniref:Uncharacterized protein n=1 Tax=Crenothrix polyspora TaxID=360316 RepID=A0A1R4GYF1_9GAMM|nr:hypothetical protein [Crenothrix polyspora]SJM88961.1 hypothetical protein CRENPOLYSF2_10009 [Crenothrix polyspora]